MEDERFELREFPGCKNHHGFDWVKMVYISIEEWLIFFDDKLVGQMYHFPWILSIPDKSSL